MQFWTRGAHISITLIGAYHDITCLSNTEVTTCHTGIGCQELITQAQTRHISKVGWVMVTFLCAELLLEEFTHIVVIQVDSGHHDMTGLLALQLDDTLTQVGLYDLYAMSLQEGIHLALLGKHTLTLHHLLDVVLLEDLQDDVVKLLRIFCPMDDTSVLLGVGRELLEVLIQMGYGVALDG